MVAEVVAGGGEMEPGRVSRVPRAALDALLTCPLCKVYFREASTFNLNHCGHTCEFCSYPRPRLPFSTLLCRAAAFLCLVNGRPHNGCDARLMPNLSSAVMCRLFSVGLPWLALIWYDFLG